MSTDRRERGKAAAIESEEIERILPPIGHQTERTARLGQFRMLAKRKVDSPVLERDASSDERCATREQDNGECGGTGTDESATITGH